jgi:hypothetical protein
MFISIGIILEIIPYQTIQKGPGEGGKAGSKIVYLVQLRLINCT